MPKILLNKSNVDLDYPICRPSLDLDFTQEVLDERITFSRGSIGTRVNRNRLIETVDANQPRFDYDPVTGECKGLLIEESRQNLLTYSEDFTTTWITSNATIQSNVITAPDGSSNADKLIENTSNGQHGNYFSRTGSNETLTFSVFCKAAERTRVLLQLSNFVNATINVTYNLSTGTIIAISASNADYTNNSASIIPYPNGWYRCILTTTKGSVNTTNIPTISTIQSTGGTYQGDGTSGIYIWGAQLETGAFPTSYIPTGASTVTRSADNASMTGTNFSSFFNSTEGTLYADLRNYNSSSTSNFGISIGSAGNNYFAFPYINSGGQLTSDVYWRETAFSKILDFPTGGSGGKYAISYKNGQSFFGYLNGSSGSVDKPPYPNPTGYNQLYIGRSHFSSSNQNFYLRRLTYYPRALKPNQLQYLTQ